MAKEVALDLWICKEFRVLPTEERFKKLSDEQKYLLFSGFLEQPTSEDMHRSYWEQNRVKLDAVAKKGLKKAGYSEKAIARIRENLQKAGMM